MKFEELNLHSVLLNKTKECGFTELTYIQEKCIGKILAGIDVVGQAETGSGKTLAFALPILNKIIRGNGVQALILTPTRELCVQVADVFEEFGQDIGIKIASVYGGVSITNQITKIKKSEIVVGTPGRILDHLSRKTLHLNNICFLVLDETDRMLDMGFIDDVNKIISYTPKSRQTLMFSATISNEIHYIMEKYLRDPLIIKTKAHVPEHKLKQVYYDIAPQNRKFSLLTHLLKYNSRGLSIVFCATRDQSDILAKNLKRQDINAVAIHGGMTQNKRTHSLNLLRNQGIDVLVATDVAARGLDIKNIMYVYNYDVPNTAKDYTHRIGRTARAGENGVAVTLLTERDHDNFRRIQREYERQIERAEIPRFNRVAFIKNPARKQSPYNGQNKKRLDYKRRRNVKSRDDVPRTKRRHRRHF